MRTEALSSVFPTKRLRAGAREFRQQQQQQQLENKLTEIIGSSSNDR